jgi:tetratricopeptide (TPR) repeat protein
VLACILTISCTSTAKPTVQPTPNLGKNLTPFDLSSLLIGEFALQRGQKKTATIHFLAAAKSTQNLDAAKRATYSAQFYQDADLLSQSSLLWSQLAPQDPLPWQYIAQAASVNLQFDKAIQALIEELKRGGGDGLPYVASLSINETAAVQKNLQDHFQSWLSAYPKHPQLHYALAILAKALGQFDAATLHINQALALDAKNLQVQIFYTQLLLANQDLQAADEYLSQYTQPLMNAPGLLINQHAQVLTLMTQYARAYEYFSELVRRYPQHLRYRYSAGILAYENSYYVLAKTHLNKVIALDPNSHSALYYMALNALRQDLTDQAIYYLNQVKKGADRLNAFTLLIDLNGPNQQQQEEYFQALRDQNEDLATEVYALEIHFLLGTGQQDLATQTYQQALKQHPNNIPLLYGYALLAQSLHQLNITEKMLQRIIDIEPDHINALNALGYSYAEQGINLLQAKLLINRALALAPNNAAIIDSLGWVNYRLGHLRQAHNLLTRAYDIMPSTEIAAHLGVVEWALGDTQSAFKTWNFALEKDPNNALIKQAILDAQNEFQRD